MSTERSLGDWMRQRRADLDLTQEMLAEQAGCAAETIRALENGRRRASREMADRLAIMLHIPAEERAAFVTLARALVSPARKADVSPPTPGDAGEVEQTPVRAPTLVATKLYRPRLGHDIVVRARLVERLEQGLAGPLTLISAPAGFGKTTLAAELLGRLSLPSAWLALDVHDDTPGAFLRYFAAALKGIDREVGAQVSDLLGVSDTVAPQAIIATLLNDLAVLAHDVAVVVDDYHVITHPAIHEAVGYLLDHLPPRFHLVILTREDPPLPLARLRARRQLVELRAADLRFTVDEATAFLRASMRLSLGADNIAALVRRTEGWIVGLQLAALSLRDLDSKELASSIDAFTGNNRFVVDYLMDEVLAGQPAHLQQFLLQTSPLDRMCGPLCDAVLGLTNDQRRTGEASVTGGQWPVVDSYSQRLLEELERANLFVIPLDNERRWYRYHQLFGDVLRARLLSGAAPENVVQLRLRASVWSESQGMVAEAVQYALAGGDWEQVMRLIEQQGTHYALHGHIETVLGWLNAIPDDLIRTQPIFCVLHAGLLLSTDQLGKARVRLQWAEQLVAGDETNPRLLAVGLQVAAMWSTLARFAGDLPRSVALGHTALDRHAQGRPLAAAVISVGHQFLVDGDVSPGVERQLAARVAELMEGGHPAVLLRGSILLAWMHVLQGRLRDAERMYREAVLAIPGQEAGLAVVVGGAAYYFGMGEFRRERNELEDAARLLDQGMVLVRGTLAIEPDILFSGMLSLARVQQACGDGSAAMQTLRELDQLARERGFAPYLRARAAAAQAWLASMQGQLHGAIEWADRSGLDADGTPGYLHELEYLTLARVRIVQARRDPEAHWLDDAVQILDRLLEAAEAGARTGSTIEILILQALARDVGGDYPAALAALARALILAEPEGYVRIFLDEGAPMAALLARGLGDRSWGIRDDAQASRVCSYAQQLLEAFGAAVVGQP